MKPSRRVALAIVSCIATALVALPVFWTPALAEGPANLLLTPASQTVNVGDTFTVGIALQPNSQQVMGIDAFVDFDPAHLMVTQLAAAPSSPFNFQLGNGYDNELGHADYSVGTLTPPPTTGSLSIATITFKALSATTNTSLTFSSAQYRHTDVGYEGNSVLGMAIGASVAIASVQPAAAFSANVTSGVRPLTVNFTDNSTGNPTAWAWTFGDGGTSNAQNPSHVYTEGGLYDVKLTVTAAGATYTATRTGYITVIEPTPTPAPTATPVNTPPPTVINPPPTIPAATRTPTPAATSASGSPTPTPTPVPGAGGNDFGALIPWAVLAGAALIASGLLMKGRARRRS